MLLLVRRPLRYAAYRCFLQASRTSTQVASAPTALPALLQSVSTEWVLGSWKSCPSPCGFFAKQEQELYCYGAQDDPASASRRFDNAVCESRFGEFTPPSRVCNFGSCEVMYPDKFARTVSGRGVPLMLFDVEILAPSAGAAGFDDKRAQSTPDPETSGNSSASDGARRHVMRRALAEINATADSGVSGEDTDTVTASASASESAGDGSTATTTTSSTTTTTTTTGVPTDDTKLFDDLDNFLAFEHYGEFVTSSVGSLIRAVGGVPSLTSEHFLMSARVGNRNDLPSPRVRVHLGIKPATHANAVAVLNRVQCLLTDSSGIAFASESQDATVAIDACAGMKRRSEYAEDFTGEDADSDTRLDPKFWRLVAQGRVTLSWKTQRRAYFLLGGIFHAQSLDQQRLATGCFFVQA